MMLRIFLDNVVSFSCGGRKGEVEEQKKRGYIFRLHNPQIVIYYLNINVSQKIYINIDQRFMRNVYNIK